MNLNLAGKVVAITGGTSGIGKAVADKYAQNGCKLAICGTRPENTEKVRKEFEDKNIPVYAELVDVKHRDKLHQFADHIVDHYGRIDIWLNHAGISHNTDLLEITPEEWSLVMQTNLDSALWGIQAAGRHMKKTGGGVILNSASFTAKISNIRKAAYSASKAGMIALIRVAAAALAPYNIRVNGVACGSIQTPLQFGRAQEDIDRTINKIALHRFGTAEEAAGAYVFLGSDEASYITGEVIEVSGGKFCTQDTEIAWLHAKQEL